MAKEVVVEADQDFKFGQGVVADINLAQGVRLSPGGVGDHIGVTSVGLRTPGMQVGDAAHGQAGQLGSLQTQAPSDRDRQSADRGRLVHDHQHRAVLGEFRKDLPQPGLGVDQRGVMQPFPVTV
jgi:hypothetical protein